MKENTDEELEKKKTAAGKDFDKNVALYREYVSTAETQEERKERLKKFRCR